MPRDESNATPDNLDVLIQKLAYTARDDDPVYQQIAAFGSAALPKILPLLDRSDDYTNRTDACFLLGEIGDPVAIPALVWALCDWDVRHVVPQAQIALRKLGAPALEALISASSDPNPILAHAAIDTLGLFPEPESKHVLVEFASGDDWWVRLHAAESLVRTGECGYLQNLADALPGEDDAARYALHAYTRIIRDKLCLDAVRDIVVPVYRELLNRGWPAPDAHDAFQQRATFMREVQRQLDELAV